MMAASIPEHLLRIKHVLHTYAHYRLYSSQSAHAWGTIIPIFTDVNMKPKGMWLVNYRAGI